MQDRRNDGHHHRFAGSWLDLAICWIGDSTNTHPFWSHLAAAILTYHYWPEGPAGESSWSSLRQMAEEIAVNMFKANNDLDHLRRIISAREDVDDLVYARMQMERLGISFESPQQGQLPGLDDPSDDDPA